MLNKEYMCEKWVQVSFNASWLSQKEKLVHLAISCCTNEHGKGSVSFNFIKQKTKFNSDELITTLHRLKELGHIELITESTYRLVTFNTTKGSNNAEATAA